MFVLHIDVPCNCSSNVIVSLFHPFLDFDILQPWIITSHSFYVSTHSSIPSFPTIWNVHQYTYIHLYNDINETFKISNIFSSHVRPKSCGNISTDIPLTCTIQLPMANSLALLIQITRNGVANLISLGCSLCYWLNNFYITPNHRLLPSCSLTLF